MPGRNLCGFFRFFPVVSEMAGLIPPEVGADFFIDAFLTAMPFLGALEPVTFLAVCLVRAII